MPDGSPSLKSVERSFRILEFIRDNEPVSLTRVSESLDVPKSTMHRHLSTLVSAGYLVREDGIYRLSFEFLSYANRIQLRDPAYPMIKRKVRDLAEESEEFVQFSTDEEDRLVYLFKETGRNGLFSRSDARTFRPLHSTAGGKAILSTWPREAVETYIDRSELEGITENTITDPDALFDELDLVRDRGYAVNNEETVEGLGALSVPIENTDDGVVGALGISGPVNRVGSGNEEYAELLLDAKKEVELNIRLL
ncbi:IclR family transcriptional regulator [Halolamina litorea]|uniref:IclR family transcriptional regulator n=1 Tax=Halolamina litorea TaxID=1515593 RepID=A0ABD6BRD1_9EURY|nr:IclR family transcriptional regulator [Halolamina litorea]